MDFPKVYDLTRLTRGAAAERRVVISVFEFRARHLAIAGAALVLGLLTAFALWPWANSAGLMSILVWFGVLFWLLEMTTRRGLQLSNWKTLRYKATDQSGKFFLSGEEFDPLDVSFMALARRSVPVERDTTESDWVALPATRERKPHDDHVQVALAAWDE